MTPYGWEETEDQYLALLQPRENFVEGSIYEDEEYRHGYETEWMGVSKESGEEDVFAFGFLKKWCTREQAEKVVSWTNDGFSWRPEEHEHQEQSPSRRVA